MTNDRGSHADSHFSRACFAAIRSAFSREDERDGRVENLADAQRKADLAGKREKRKGRNLIRLDG